MPGQACSQKLLLGGSFGQNVVDLFYEIVDLLNVKSWLFKQNNGPF